MGLRNFISVCLYKQPDMRATVEQLLSHAFLAEDPFAVGSTRNFSALQSWLSIHRPSVDLDLPEHFKIIENEDHEDGVDRVIVDNFATSTCSFLFNFAIVFMTTSKLSRRFLA